MFSTYTHVLIESKSGESDSAAMVLVDAADRRVSFPKLGRRARTLANRRFSKAERAERFDAWVSEQPLSLSRARGGP
jgi:hypothetical protein